MKLNMRKLAPLAILGGLILIATVIRMNPPASPPRTAPQLPLLAVETITVHPRDYRVELQSYGTVQPRTQSMLVAQVGGQIISVNPNVRDGGFFEAGDALVTIDPRDYEADVRIAEASLMDARQALVEAEARSAQAREDWERLGNEGEPGELVLRIPQLEAAKARLISARSALDKAKLDLERTTIHAPFAGRILEKKVDVGQVVSPSTQLAEIYATDYVEIRLPLKNRDLPFIDLPESFRFGGPETSEAQDSNEVEILSELGGTESWRAKLVRTEGAIDESARQLHVIAQIDDPFGEQNRGRTPIKIGQYVTASIQGKTVVDALVIPNPTVYQGSYVYVVTDGVLKRKDIEIAWQNDKDAIIASGLNSGEELITTPLGQVVSGVRVSVIGKTGKEGKRTPDNELAGSTENPINPRDKKPEGV